jgi:hypothetical protein
MGRNKKKVPAPDTPARRKALRKQQLDAIMREASDVVLSQIRKMKDSQIEVEKGKKIPVAELPTFVNLQEIARTFERRLQGLDSNVDALGQRLQKWRLRGVDDDPIVSRGRPRTLVPSPLSSRTVAVVANRAQGHLGAQAVLAVVGDRTGQPRNAGVSKQQQKTIFQRMREESGVIKGRGKYMTPVLIHATTCRSIIGKFHLNMQAAYKKVPVFRTEPMRIANVDESNKADRAGRDGRIASAVTTVERIKKRGYTMLRPMSLNDSAEGPSSACNWILASGDVLAKTPIGKAPPGYVIPEDFAAPVEWTMPATHSGEPFLPGMSKDYFTNGNSRVYCTPSGSNNAACFAHMFMHTAYPLWRKRVPDGPLMLIYDSCHAHNWTEELASFCGSHDVHIVKLFHNTTTRTQPLDCGFNLSWRNIVHSAQDNIIAAGIFKHAYLNRNMICNFEHKPKSTRSSPRHASMRA